MSGTKACVVMILLLCAAAYGCSLSGKPRGASLSDAAQEAKKEPEEKKKVVKAEPPEETPDSLLAPSDTEILLGLVEGGESEPPAEPEEPPESEGTDGWHFGGIAGFSYQSGDDFDRYGVFGLNFGVHNSRQRTHVDLGVVFLTTQTKPGSETAGAIKDEREVALDFSVRYYFTPSYTFTGIYVLGGLRYGAFAWKWASPIQVETDGEPETIESDLVGVFSMYFGLGLSLVQTNYFKLGVNATGGFKLYHSTTLEGFDNDIFGSSGIVQIMFPITFGKFD
jgi:hypothetical protein